MAMVYGTVGDYDPQRGVGFALGQDGSGRKYRFTAADLADGAAPIAAGVHVSFEPVSRSRYWRASHVRRVAAPEPRALPRAGLSGPLRAQLDAALLRWTESREGRP